MTDGPDPQRIWVPDDAARWVRWGVADEIIAEMLFEQSRDVLEYSENSPLKQALALHYIRGLGGRHLLNMVAEILCKCLVLSSDRWQHLDHACLFSIKNPLSDYVPQASTWRDIRRAKLQTDDTSYFVPDQPHFAEETLGRTALTLICELAPSGHSSRQTALCMINHHLNGEVEYQGSLDKWSDWIWDLSGPRDNLTVLLTHATQALEGRHDRARELALRLALISPEYAEQACRVLSKLGEDTKCIFVNQLEKQLKRVGKVRLWVRCRDILSK